MTDCDMDAAVGAVVRAAAQAVGVYCYSRLVGPVLACDSLHVRRCGTDSAECPDHVAAVLDQLAALLLAGHHQSHVAQGAPALQVAAAVTACKSACGSYPPRDALASNSAAQALLSDLLLRGVTPQWLPRSDAQYAQLVDGLMGTLSADSALEALCALCADEQPHTAGTARRLLLSRFLAPSSPGLAELAQAWPGNTAGSSNVRSHARCEQLLSQLLALPDKAALHQGTRSGAASSPSLALLLSHDTLFDALARGAADAVASSGDGSTRRTASFATAVWARIARRGGAAAVAGALMATHSTVGPQLLAGIASTDVSTATRVMDALLRRVGESPSLMHAERVRIAVTSLLPALQQCRDMQTSFGTILPLRRPLWCRSTLVTWLDCVLLNDAMATALPSLRADALQCLSRTWADPAMVSSPGGAATSAMHAYLTAALVAILQVPGRDSWLTTLRAWDPVLTQTLLGGISARLGAPLPEVRLGGMRVASALADAMNAEEVEARRASEAPGSTSRLLPQLFANEAATPPLPGDLWGSGLWKDTICDDAAEADDAPTAAPPTPAIAQEKCDSGVKPVGELRASASHMASEALELDSDDESVDELGSLSPYDMSDTEDVCADADGGPDGVRDEAPVPAAPVPTSLKGLLDALRAGASAAAGNSVPSGSAPGGPTASAVCDAALCGAEELIRSCPAELPLFAQPLAIALLSAPPAWVDVDAEADDNNDGDGDNAQGGGTRRRLTVRVRAMAALLACCPSVAAKTLSHHFTAAQLDVGTRLEILDVLCLAAEELASVTLAPGPALPKVEHTSTVSSKPSSGDVKQQPRSRPPPVTRIKAPVALAVRARGPRPSGINRFGPAADAFAAPLLSATAAALGVDNARRSVSAWEDMSPLAWLRAPARGVDGTHLPAADDPASSLVLGRLLVTLGHMCACAARTTAATQLPAAVLTLLATRPGSARPLAAGHGQPYVRRSAHYAAAKAMAALPPAWMAALLEEGATSQVVDAMETVCDLAKTAQGGAEPDAESRVLAARVLVARHELATSAADVLASLPADGPGAQISARVPSLEVRMGM